MLKPNNNEKFIIINFYKKEIKFSYQEVYEILLEWVDKGMPITLTPQLCDILYQDLIYNFDAAEKKEIKEEPFKKFLLNFLKMFILKNINEVTTGQSEKLFKSSIENFQLILYKTVVHKLKIKLKEFANKNTIKKENNKSIMVNLNCRNPDLNNRDNLSKDIGAYSYSELIEQTKELFAIALKELKIYEAVCKNNPRDEPNLLDEADMDIKEKWEKQLCELNLWNYLDDLYRFSFLPTLSHKGPAIWIDDLQDMQKQFAFTRLWIDDLQELKKHYGLIELNLPIEEEAVKKINISQDKYLNEIRERYIEGIKVKYLEEIKSEKYKERVKNLIKERSNKSK